VIRPFSVPVAAVVALSAWTAPGAAQTGPDAKQSAEQKQSRYQIGVMERVLEGAVEHGVTMTRDRMQAALPVEMQFISENARVRGFRLDGYGVFFDVIVPSFETTMPWALRTLDQNDLGLDSALKALKAHVDAAGDINLEQALRRVELQVSPMMTSAAGRAPAASARGASGARTVAESAAVADDPAAPNQPAANPAAPKAEDPILADPN